MVRVLGNAALRRGSFPPPRTAPAGAEDLPGMTLRYVVYEKADPAARRDARAAFLSEARGRLLRHVTLNFRDGLHRLGLDDAQITRMRQGHLPENLTVHHKVPLDGGGSNDLSNLVLMRLFPYAENIHRFIHPQISGLSPGERKPVKIPVPDSVVYAPGAPTAPAGQVLDDPGNAFTDVENAQGVFYGWDERGR